MTEISLVRARYAYSFAACLDKLGVPLTKLLKEFHLSPNLLENQEGVITARQLWGFAGEASLRAGLPELGLLAGRVPVVDHGSFGRLVYQGVTLFDAIKIFCDNAVKEYSRADFYLLREGNQSWFCRGPIEGSAFQIQQVELYLVALMIDTIKLAGGSGWAPQEIDLQTFDVKSIRDSQLLKGINIRFGRPNTKIGFNSCLLAQPLVGEIAVFSRPENQFDDIMESPDFARSLRCILSSHVGYVDINLQVSAEILGTSYRSLQRQLATADVSFRELLDQVRFEKALVAINEGESSFSEIAHELGYANVAHFTRAFRRWAGTSPTEYIRLKTLGCNARLK